MGRKLRRLLGSGTENTPDVLATAQHWEALRAAFHQHHGRNQLADNCFQLSSTSSNFPTTSIASTKEASNELA